MQGIKHLVQCHCILPQYRNLKEPKFHQFSVFSVVDDSDVIEPKLAACNNCGVLHRVIDVCRSEIVTNREDSATAMKREDFKHSLPSSLYEVLQQYERDVVDYEHAQFIIDNEQWESTIVLSREESGGILQGKMVRFISAERFRIESYSSQDFVESK
jgi:hypothetical protein